MSLTTRNTYPFYRPRLRWDVINGVKTGPFNDPLNQLAFRVVVDRIQVPTNNFGKLKRSGARLPMNTYRLYKETIKIPSGGSNIHLKTTWIPTGDYSVYIGPLSEGFNTFAYLQPSAAEKASLESNLNAKLLSKIKNMKVNLGNFAAERNQMFRMFGSTAKKLVRALRALKQGNLKKAFQALGCLPSKRLSTRKSVANNWLELQYGWLPLLSDLYEMSLLVEEAFDDVSEKPPQRVATSVVRKTSMDVQSLVRPPGAKVRRQYAAQLRGKVSYTVNCQEAAFLGSVGLTNPLSVAWEVLPFSFLVDWALPIGRMLENLDATIGCTLIDIVHGYECRLVGDYTCPAALSIEGNYKYEWKNLSGRAYWFQYDRGVPLSGGWPRVELPQFKNPFSAAHAANALALLSQNFR